MAAWCKDALRGDAGRAFRQDILFVILQRFIRSGTHPCQRADRRENVDQVFEKQGLVRLSGVGQA